MSKRNCRFFIVMVAFVWLVARSGLAGVTNGEFIYGLDAWTVESGTVEHSVDDEAMFEPDLYGAPTSTLSQMFTLDTGALTLCFDVRMETESENGTPETDVFTASLLNSLDNPMICVPGETYFYSLDSNGDEEIATGVSVMGGTLKTISLDVSSWAGEEVKLRFSLEHDYADDVDTYAFLDNVGVPIVPGPSALMLAGLGVGLASWLRRYRVL